MSEPHTAQPPPLTGRRVQLRPVHQADYPLLMAMFTDPEVTHRWRSRGRTLSPEAFQGMLWNGVFAQFLIERDVAPAPEPMGLISGYSADTANGTAYLSILMRPRVGASLWTLEALAIFLNYSFAHFNIRKFYAETTELSFPSFASGEGTLFETEGVLRQHHYFNGRYWDTYILAFWADRLRPYLDELLPEMLEKKEA